MRNLKRALSLTLASVMLLGMMVVGGSAVGYPDVDKNDNVEAIEVLQAVGIMGGDNNGNFNPDDYVTREQMAVIMSQLLKLDYNYYKGTNPFSDVPEWAAPYVAACAANGITAGIGDGLYGSKQNIQAVQAALMMLKALGYFQYAGDYEGGYVLATVKLASTVGLFEGIDSENNADLTRNQVAQMVLNALQAEMVSFTGDPGITYTGSNGETWVGGYKAEYTPRTSTQAKYQAIERRTSDVASEANHKGQYYIQLGEELYDGKLKLNDNTTDPFGRPARYWEYDGKDIGTYMKKELIRAEYTAKVTGKDLYDLLGKDIIESERADEKYDFFIYVDGEDRYNATDGVNGVTTVFNKTQMNKNNKATVGGTGVGTLTQVFVDADEKEVTIAVINTYLARAKADYNEKRDEVSFNVYAIKKGTANSTDYFWKAKDKANDQKETMTVSNEDFPVANVVENDPFLVTVAEGEIQTMTAPEVLSAVTLDSFKRDDNVVTEGVTYKYTTTAQYDVEVLDDYTGDSDYGVNLKDKHYNIYLDAYNNLIGIDLVENADNYVFITGVDSKSSNLAAKQYDANAIFLDGTMKTITIDNEKSTIDLRGDNALLNTWCTYTVSSNDVYTVKEVSKPAGAAGTIDSTAVGKGDSYVGLKNGTTKAIKVGQYHDLMNNVTANDSATNKIDVKHVSLRGSAASSRNSFKYVYGNDSTVYLNAEVKGIYTTGQNGDPRGVISKVTSVTTGIKNASLEIMSLTQAETQAKNKSASKSVTPAANTKDWNNDTIAGTSYGSYVLYKDNGYVIAAVTVADDASASENLVYIDSGSVKLERYDASADEWTWQRDAVHNGERITLTEVGDGISILKSVKPYNWYVVSYNAKGEVVSAEHAMDNLADKTATKYQSNINFLETTVNNPGTTTVLYERADYNGLTASYPNGCKDYDEDGDGFFFDGHTYNNVTAGAHKNNYGPKLEWNTFYDVTTNTTGFYVDDNVKVLFIQKIKNAWETEFKSGLTDLKNVIDSLIEEDTDNCGSTYHYEVSAVLENGIAKVVVIRDLHVQGDSGQTTVTTNSDLIVDTSTKGDVKVKYTSANPPATEDAVKAIREQLEKDGYTVDKLEFVAQGERGGTPASPAQDQYEFTVSKGGVPMGKFIYKSGDPASSVKEVNVTINGVGKRIAATSTALGTIASSNGVTDAGIYVKINGTITTVAGNSKLPAANDVFDFGYYKIDVASGDISTSGSAELTAALKSGEDEMYVKAVNTTVDITLTGKTAAISAPGVTISSSVGTVTAGAHINALAVGKTADITVSIPGSSINGDKTITLTAADYVGDVTMKVTYNGETKTITIPENTTSWVDVLKAAGWDSDYTARSGKVRLDSNWSKGEAVGTITDAAFVTGGKLNNNMSVTFGCVEMGRGTDAAGLAGPGAVVWTANSAAWSSTSDKQYMVPGETLTVAIDLSKLTTKIVVGAAGTPSIGLGSSAANATAAVTVTGLAGQNGAADTTALTNLGYTKGAGEKSVTITGVTSSNQINAGVITFTITVGSTADASMALDLTNS